MLVVTSVFNVPLNNELQVSDPVRIYRRGDCPMTDDRSVGVSPSCDMGKTVRGLLWSVTPRFYPEPFFRSEQAGCDPSRGQSRRGA